MNDYSPPVFVSISYIIASSFYATILSILEIDEFLETK